MNLRAALAWSGGLLVLAGAWGCAGVAPRGSAPAPLAASSAARRKIAVRVRMEFPHPKGRRPRSRRDPLYVSTYTHTVQFQMKGSTTISPSFTVTPGTGACPTAASNDTTTCSWSLDLAPGSYLATITASDQSGNVLSKAEGVPAVVKAGTGNTLSFTMYGIPTSLLVFHSDNDSYGNVVDLTVPRSFTVYPLGVTEDDRVQVIVGGGTPQIVPTRTGGSLPVTFQSSGTSFTVTAPSGTPNLGLATVVVKASFPSSDDDLCALPDANCTSPALTFTGRELIGVCCTNGVQLYGSDGTGPLATIGSGTGVQTFTFDTSGNLFVATAGSVSEYSPPYASTIATVASGVNDPVAIAAGSDGSLFVANAGANPQSVTQYVAPLASAAPAATITNGIALATPPANAPAIAEYAVQEILGGVTTTVDYLQLTAPSGMNTYTAPYTSAPQMNSGVLDFALGPFSTLFGLTSAGAGYCLSTSCEPPLASPSGGYAIAVPAPVNGSSPILYVASSDGSVYTYDTNSATSTTTYPGGFSGQPQLLPNNIATDPGGDLAVIDYQGNAVTVYTGATASANGVTFTTPTKITSGISAPQQLQFFP